MTTEFAEAESRESTRRPVRELGESIPHVDGSAPDPLPFLKPGSIGVRYRLKPRLRAYDAIACVPAFLSQVRAVDTLPGDDGARWLDGVRYTPVLVGGAAVAATNENLDAIIRAAVPDEVICAAHPAIAERQLHEAMRPSLERYLLIEDEVWIRA